MDVVQACAILAGDNFSRPNDGWVLVDMPCSEEKSFMKFHLNTAEVYVPDHAPEEQALARTTHLCFAAHQDDIEIMAAQPIIECFQQSDTWFTGVVGSGDALLGALAFALDQGRSPEIALRYGVAAGAANALHFGGGEFSRAEFDAIKRKVEVIPLRY